MLDAIEWNQPDWGPTGLDPRDLGSNDFRPMIWEPMDSGLTGGVPDAFGPDECGPDGVGHQ